MILAIDNGNTRIKMAVFEQSNALELFASNLENCGQDLRLILTKHSSINTIVVSSVGSEKLDLILKEFETIKIVSISHESRFPFKNLYKTPTTLGIDRMVLAAGATLQFPNQNKLIIDAGTCVTYDFVTQKNQYLGGAISPGMRLRYKSLHDYTAKLPLLETKKPNNAIGNSTEESIHSGVINGLAKEIDGIINDFVAENQNFIIILTGGDAIFLANRLKNTIFANPNFLLESLNLLHIYNSNND